jgi:hypothetical protein
MYINIKHHKKSSPKNSMHNPSFDIFKISNYVKNIILSWIYSICSNFSMFVEFFKIIDWMKSKANQIYLEQTKIIQDVMSIHYQKINCKKIICVITILGELSVFSPFWFWLKFPLHVFLWKFCLIALWTYYYA